MAIAVKLEPKDWGAVCEALQECSRWRGFPKEDRMNFSTLHFSIGSQIIHSRYVEEGGQEDKMAKKTKTIVRDAATNWLGDDITFCMSECGRTDCFRHPSNILVKDIPHSFAMFEGTEYCPKTKKEDHLDERT